MELGETSRATGNPLNAYEASTGNDSDESMNTLNGYNWLDDKVINSYFKLIDARSKKREGEENILRVMSLKTHFIEQIHHRGFEGVKGWTKKLNIFEDLDLMFIPMNNNRGCDHWVLVAIDFRKNDRGVTPIYYYCSLRGDDSSQYLDKIEEYLKWQETNIQDRETAKRKFKKIVVPDVPHQMNGSDCGVFICQYAEVLARNRGVHDLCNENMRAVRNRMKKELREGELDIHREGFYQLSVTGDPKYDGKYDGLYNKIDKYHNALPVYEKERKSCSFDNNTKRFLIMWTGKNWCLTEKSNYNKKPYLSNIRGQDDVRAVDGTWNSIMVNKIA